MMTSGQPWSTCVLTGMLINYLETKHADAAGRLDYRRILSTCEGFEDIPDPRAYLLDSNNWIPMTILRETMKSCEMASGVKDFAYQASIAYYANASTRSPGFLETIAILLGDVESVLRSASYWAPAYFNYLQLQAFSRTEESQTLYILVRFNFPEGPRVASFRFVQGNLEGLIKLDPQVELVSSEEQYSQLSFKNLLDEFGDNYVASFEPRQVTVTCRSTGKAVVVAKPVKLDPELVPSADPALQKWPFSEDQQLICPVTKDGLSVLLPYGQKAPPGPQRARAGAPVTALRVEQGGTLCSGPLSWTVREDTIYDAPYSRFRITWQNREAGSSEVTSERRNILLEDKHFVAQLLFNHLKNLQATQRRTLSMVIRNVELTQENIQLKEELSGQQERGGLLGNSKPLQEVLAMIRTIAPSDTTVLITGETGCGKELAARLIHQISRRRDRPFLGVQIGALAETLIESELFGHERGAFTGAVTQKKGKFELANGGTLFLDEIGDVSPAIQVKLLRVVQEKQFHRVGGTVDLKADVRLIAATNRDLEALMDQSRFRRDLYYRLNVIQLYIPPLRERTEDIPELSQYFVQRFAERAVKSIKGLTPDALNLCLAYKWPGNIRELENVMERAVTLSPENSKWITPALLPPKLQNPVPASPELELRDLVNRTEWSSLFQSLRKAGSLACLLNQLKWDITDRAVEEYGGNKSRAARALGHTYRWLRELETSMNEKTPPDHSSPPTPQD